MYNTYTLYNVSLFSLHLSSLFLVLYIIAYIFHSAKFQICPQKIWYNNNNFRYPFTHHPFRKRGIPWDISLPKMPTKVWRNASTGLPRERRLQKLFTKFCKSCIPKKKHGSSPFCPYVPLLSGAPPESGIPQKPRQRKYWTTCVRRHCWSIPNTTVSVNSLCPHPWQALSNLLLCAPEAISTRNIWASFTINT